MEHGLDTWTGKSSDDFVSVLSSVEYSLESAESV